MNNSRSGLHKCTILLKTNNVNYFSKDLTPYVDYRKMIIICEEIYINTFEYNVSHNISTKSLIMYIKLFVVDQRLISLSIIREYLFYLFYLNWNTTLLGFFFYSQIKFPLSHKQNNNY